MVLMLHTAHLPSAFSLQQTIFFRIVHIPMTFTLDFFLCVLLCGCVICFLVLLLVFFCFAGAAR